MTPELNWTKVGAIGQWAGAAATFAAVLASLYLAASRRKPRLKLRVTTMLHIGGGEVSEPLLGFSVANQGERTAHVRSIGWRTGWFRHGPKCTRTLFAIQKPGDTGHGSDPPYVLEPGQEIASYSALGDLLDQCREEVAEPLFSRDWPLLGRRATRVLAQAYTADGYTIKAAPDPKLIAKLRSAERDALRKAGPAGR